MDLVSSFHDFSRSDVAESVLGRHGDGEVDARDDLGRRSVKHQLAGTASFDA
jgi:hypothetical protein